MQQFAALPSAVARLPRRVVREQRGLFLRERFAAKKLFKKSRLGVNLF
jgi:hypothetical protein